MINFIPNLLFRSSFLNDTFHSKFTTLIWIEYFNLQDNLQGSDLVKKYFFKIVKNLVTVLLKITLFVSIYHLFIKPHYFKLIGTIFIIHLVRSSPKYYPEEGGHLL